LIVAVAAASLLCCLKQRHVSIRPERMVEGPGVVMMAYASSRVKGFRDARGLICPPITGRVRDDLIGWQSKDQDPACVHDTLDDGVGPAALELRWRVVVPKDGRYEIVPSGFGLGAWGSIVSRGSSIGDYVSKATAVIDGRAKSCVGSWSLELAKSMVTGPWARVAAFSGWIEMPNISLGKCTGGDTLEVSVRLVGESNRGRINVDWFGISARKDDDADRIFALRPKPGEPIRPTQDP
jgi:hypothetical protein